MSEQQKTSYSILVVEDTKTLAVLYEEALVKAGCDVRIAETGNDALKSIHKAPPDLVLMDMKLPDANGIELLRDLREDGYDGRVIIITGYGSLKNVIDAMRFGASDFLIKPFNVEKLKESVARELSDGPQIVNPVRITKKPRAEKALQNAENGNRHGFIGNSAPMQKVYAQIEQAAQSDATIFITGESGTGKDVCAEAIHRASPRADMPFIPLNCAAIPRDLMESELFGHVKGAFTGAISDREGAASQACGGTLFLDEIAEMNPEMQTKLLRFVQTLSFVKIGGTKQEKTDIRIVCATNRDPLQEIRKGRFREDLFYRLHVIPVDMPPLSERGEDKLALAKAFLERYAAIEGKVFEKIDPKAAHVIKHYKWPGNVRQLQNEMHRIVVMNDCRIVTKDMLSPLIHQSQTKNIERPPENDNPAIRTLADMEHDAIENAIGHCGGNIPQAAAALGVSPSTLYRKRRRWSETGLSI